MGAICLQRAVHLLAHIQLLFTKETNDFSYISSRHVIGHIVVLRLQRTASLLSFHIHGCDFVCVNVLVYAWQIQRVSQARKLSNIQITFAVGPRYIPIYRCQLETVPAAASPTCVLLCLNVDLHSAKAMLPMGHCMNASTWLHENSFHKYK